MNSVGEYLYFLIYCCAPCTGRKKFNNIIYQLILKELGHNLDILVQAMYKIIVLICVFT